MKNITVEYLKSINACDSGIKAFESKYPNDAKLDAVIQACLDSKDNHIVSDGSWLICRCFNKSQKIQYAIYAAELVLHIYEANYPGNKAPRKAIEAAKAYLANPCDKTKNAAAAYAAADAAYARTTSLRISADICREYLTEEVFKAYKRLK